MPLLLLYLIISQKFSSSTRFFFDKTILYFKEYTLIFFQQYHFLWCTWQKVSNRKEHWNFKPVFKSAKQNWIAILGFFFFLSELITPELELVKQPFEPKS